MSRIPVWFWRAVMIVALAALALVSLVPGPAYALTAAAEIAPAAPTADRLQRAWAREQRIYARLGRFFDRADERLARAQQLIDRARAHGKDVSALQAGLDGLAASVKQARPIYEAGNGIVASHRGFDGSGDVTDAVKALDTVQQMRSKLLEIRQIVRPAAVAFREAVREFRQANRPLLPVKPGGA